METPYRPIQFYYQGRIHRVEHAPVTRTLLQYLREDLTQTGTKEGCGEGDCGACTVVVGERVLDQDGREKLQLRALNSCIQLLPAMDGKALFTVEDVAKLLQGQGQLHPVQQALVDTHGSQCGFCTPGFIMSLWALYENYERCPDKETVLDALSGNLCRCTGYRPIVDSVAVAYQQPRAVWDQGPILAALREMAGAPALVYEGGGHRAYVPRNLAELGQLRLDHPEARLVAGSTDVGLWVTKQLRDLGDTLHLGQVAELKLIQVGDDSLDIGAGVSLTDAFACLTQEWPEWADLARRFASRPVKNAGTLGGNVANGSPIGDSMPALIALGARVVLQKGTARRELALEDFYLGYQKNALTPGEFLATIRLPRRHTQAGRLVFRAYKLSKRYEQDISAVCAAFALHLDPTGKILQARVAFGGMAATPKRAPATEGVLAGQVWNAATAAAGAQALAQDYAPMSDVRARKEYRLAAAANLLQRFWQETGAPGQAPETPQSLRDFAPI